LIASFLLSSRIRPTAIKLTVRDSRKAPTSEHRRIRKRPGYVDGYVAPYPTDDMVIIVSQMLESNVEKSNWPTDW